MKTRKWSAILAMLLAGLWIGSPALYAKDATTDDANSSATDTQKVTKKAKKAKRKAKKAADDATAAADTTKKEAEDKADTTAKKVSRKARKAKSAATESVSNAASATAATAAATVATPPAVAAPAAQPVPAPAATEKKSNWKDLLGGGSKEPKAATADKVSSTHRVDGKLDLNTATQAELEAIPGIGSSTAQQIIAGRPYTRKDELKKKGILSDDAYEKAKEEIIAHAGK